MHINKTITSTAFKKKHRLSKTAFTRKRSLDFPTLILYLLNLRKHSNQTELDQFYKTIQGKKEASQVITKSAFFQARKQLSHTAFKSLNQQIVDDVYSGKWKPKTWKGFRLCAIDGTSIRLPNEHDIIEHFGVQKGRPEQGQCTMGMASIFYDVLNKIVIDSGIHPRRTSEKQCAEDHLAFSHKNDLVLFDRGYTAFWLYAYLLQHNIAFCMRAKSNQDLLVKAFVKSGKKEAIVSFTPNKPSIKTCEEKGLSSKPVTLRLVRVDLPNEVEVLITNLMDKTEYNASIFKSLYHLRWGIEENYKRLKQWAEIENFSGKSALSVQQDFYAKIVASNLTTLIEIQAQETVDKRTQYLRRNYQINYAQALSKMKHRIILLITAESAKISSLIKQSVMYISKTIEAVRGGRSYPRRLKNIKNDIHFPAYKSSL